MKVKVHLVGLTGSGLTWLAWLDLASLGWIRFGQGNINRSIYAGFSQFRVFQGKIVLFVLFFFHYCAQI